MEFHEFANGVFYLLLASIIGNTIYRTVKARAAGSEALPALRAELDELRGQLQSRDAQLQELQERVDFAERLLAQVRDRQPIGAGASPASASSAG